MPCVKQYRLILTQSESINLCKQSFSKKASIKCPYFEDLGRELIIYDNKLYGRCKE